MERAAIWIADLLTGSIAVSVAVLAVAAIGFQLLQGRIHHEKVLGVIVGCFIIFGASVIASALIEETGASSAAAASLAPSGDVSPAVRGRGYDPYAGAAVPDRRPAKERILD